MPVGAEPSTSRPSSAGGNGRCLNGGRACKALALKCIEQAFIEFKFGKSRYSHVLPLCGALIIDVTAVIFICCMDIAFQPFAFPMLPSFT